MRKHVHQEKRRVSERRASARARGGDERACVAAGRRAPPPTTGAFGLKSGTPRAAARGPPRRRLDTPIRSFDVYDRRLNIVIGVVRGLFPVNVNGCRRGFRPLRSPCPSRSRNAAATRPSHFAISACSIIARRATRRATGSAISSNAAVLRGGGGGGGGVASRGESFYGADRHRESSTVAASGYENAKPQRRPRSGSLAPPLLPG